MTIASDLDVFERVGRGVAHDEYIEFDVKDGKILYEGEESEISAGKIRVEFIKVEYFYVKSFLYIFGDVLSSFFRVTEIIPKSMQ